MEKKRTARDVRRRRGMPGLTADAGAVTRGDLHWRACSEAPGFQCASLRAPLDYDAPSGPRITLGLIRLRASDPTRRIGSLLWNSGGPGGAPTVDLPKFAPFFSPQVRARFDIVGLDPRGIGRSAQLRCFRTPKQGTDLFGKLPPAGFPKGAAETRRAISTYAQLARACAKNGGPIQNHMSTANVARDMDRVRSALGEPRLNYYGPSYGSYLGATYANLFPSRVRRIVLDGNAPPVEWNDARRGRSTNTFTRIRSAAGTEAALQMMLKECGAVDTIRCAFSAGSPSATAQKYRTLLDRIRARPVTVEGNPLTYSLLVSTVASGLFSQNTSSLAPGWKELAATLQALWSATESPSRSAAAPTLPRRVAPQLGTMASKASGRSGKKFPPVLQEGTYGVLCGESPNPSDPASYRAQAAFANATQSPSGFGNVWTWLGAPCAPWRARDADRYTGPWSRSPVPVLVLGTLGDPNTAYTGAVQMAAQLKNARLLTETGGGHTALTNPSVCMNDYVDRYFVDGTLPPPNTACVQNQQPF